MKKYRRSLPILLTLALVLSAFGVFGSYAADSTTAPPAVEELKAYSSYESVVLKWNPVNVSGATVKYLVNGKEVKTKKAGNKLQYRVKKLTPGETYTFKVQAFVGTGNNKKESAPQSVSKAPVRRIAYRVKVKNGGTLKSKRGKKAKYRLKSGQTLYTDRFATGRYIFDHNGSTFYASRSRLGKKKAIYTKKFNYTREEAEFFVNDRKIGSKKDKLIWVSTYTQHIYVFEGKKGNWKCIKDWECATGSASTPTPTSMSGLKQIGRKIRSKNSLPYWSAFHGEASFHGKRSSWDLGEPASNGCVRNANKNAKYIYDKAKKKTQVIFY